MSSQTLQTDLRELIMTTRASMVTRRLSLLDLLSESDCARPEWVSFLRQEADIEVADAVVLDRLRPDFSRWELDPARRHRAVVLRDERGQLSLAMEDPLDEVVIGRVGQRLGAALRPLAVARSAVEDWLASAAIPTSGPTAAPADADAAKGPIVAFVDRALRAAFDEGASDVHFESDREGVTARHRIDGVLVRFERMNGVLAAQETISRIKVLAMLDITERRLPQDGRFRMGLDGIELDMRVSVMPSVHGEDAVLRLLDKARLRGRQQAITLDLLGFDAAAAARIRALAQLPSGMLLVTGPTGSGKTTTVYAALSEINTGLEKIVTIEDPVEYELPGVLQIPVNERKGLTFAKGLRSILRHDPDRILVGEIRDGETAEIAIQSALTGHLVFTTVHANNIGDIIGRFRHFGLDMFGFVSALNGVVVQRLLRRLCQACAAPRAVTPSERQWMERHGCLTPSALMGPAGCPECHQSGYAGRFVVAEVHAVDDEMRDDIIQGAPLSVLKAHAAKQSIDSLLVQSMRLIEQGQTTFEEVRRVVGLV